MYFVYQYYQYRRETINYCQDVGPYLYREQVYLPRFQGIYEKRLAVALLDVSLNVTRSNCTEGELTLPPGFNQSEKFLECHIFYNLIERTMLIVFSGTFTVGEWYIDLQFIQVPCSRLNNYIDGCLCHEGFYMRYLQMRDFIWGVWNRISSQIGAVFITGHSLGGALSTLCCFDFTERTGNARMTHYSFASPRVGNPTYADRFNYITGMSSLRVNNTEDIIPQLPPASIEGYTYQHTIQNVPFTVSLGSLTADHIEAYKCCMPP